MALTPSPAAVEQARKLGARAAEHLRATGMPTRNPFADVPDLAPAWRAGYFTRTVPDGRPEPTPAARPYQHPLGI